jgi:hypothetical protein
VKRELERIALPDEHAARERAWAVVQAGFAEREPAARERHRLRLATAIAIVAALVAAALSPPGRAVLSELRAAVGVETAEDGLFSLPAPGQLLVASDAGVWVVQRDGSKRLLGDYREASWSPFGRFVVAARANELAALEPDGGVRWTLGRPGVTAPRWTGSETDTRIAYVDRSGIRIVAGDGTDDRLLAPRRGPVTWRAGRGHVLATLQGSRILLQDTDSGRVLGRAFAGPAGDVLGFEWSPSGRHVLVTHPWELDLVDVERRARVTIPIRGRDAVSAAWSPDGRTIAVATPTSVLLYDVRRPRAAPRRLFAGAGPFAGLAWSPDGRWLLLDWPAADQWVFLRADGRSIRAVAHLSEQFRSQASPRTQGWCCAAP